MRYALIVVQTLHPTRSFGLSRQPSNDQASSTIMVPRFRGVFESTEALLEHVRNDQGRAHFIIKHAATGELEEWKGTEGRFILQPLKDTLSVHFDSTLIALSADVWRVAAISPRGQRVVLEFWVEELGERG